MPYTFSVTYDHAIDLRTKLEEALNALAPSPPPTSLNSWNTEDEVAKYQSDHLLMMRIKDAVNECKYNYPNGFKISAIKKVRVMVNPAMPLKVAVRLVEMMM